MRDKNTLIESRRKIEQLMETYKQFEKDSKTKAYSNDGLASQRKFDPKEDEKNQGRDFIKRAQETLQSHIN